MQVGWVYFRHFVHLIRVPFHLGLYLSGHLLAFSSSLVWFGFMKRYCVFICRWVEQGCPHWLALIPTFQLFWFQYLKLDTSAKISGAHRCCFCAAGALHSGCLFRLLGALYMVS